MRVLLVVRHALLSEALHKVLVDLGHEVANCQSADGAVRVALEHRPHSVVLDVSLPNTQAEDLGRSILAARPDAVLIGLSPTGAPDSMPSACRAGFSAWVSTDAPLDQFLALLEDVVEAPDDGRLARAGALERVRHPQHPRGRPVHPARRASSASTEM